MFSPLRFNDLTVITEGHQPIGGSLLPKAPESIRPPGIHMSTFDSSLSLCVDCRRHARLSALPMLLATEHRFQFELNSQDVTIT
jgi:hypothetical protein